MSKFSALTYGVCGSTTLCFMYQKTQNINKKYQVSLTLWNFERTE